MYKVYRFLHIIKSKIRETRENPDLEWQNMNERSMNKFRTYMELEKFCSPK
jgi:hypothetical protein